MSDETKGPENESEQLTSEELAKVAGGAAVGDVTTGTMSGYHYCDDNGNVHFGTGTPSTRYRYDYNTRTCVRVS